MITNIENIANAQNIKNNNRNALVIFYNKIYVIYLLNQ